MKAVALILFTAGIGLSAITSAGADSSSSDSPRPHSDQPIAAPQSRAGTPAGSSSSASSTSKPVAGGSYTVKEGDTLSAIARRHRISLTRIMDLNNLDEQNRIRVGQQLRVPGASGRAASSASKSSDKIRRDRRLRSPGTSGSTVSSSSKSPEKGRVGQQPRVLGDTDNTSSSDLKSPRKSRSGNPPSPTPAAGRRPRGPVIIITNPKPIVSHG